MQSAWLHDAVPLPAAGLKVGAERDRIDGMLSTGWMAYDGEWKLCKYADGQIMLFDRSVDPGERVNLVDGRRFAGELRRMDEDLSREILRSVRAGCCAQRAMAGSLSHSGELGRHGWQRPYPGAVER